MKNQLKALPWQCSAGFVLFVAIMLLVASCNRGSETRFVEQMPVPKPAINFQAEETKHHKPYTSHNSVIIISGYREGEYWVLRHGPNGKIIWDSLSLNIPADTLH